MPARYRRSSRVGDTSRAPSPQHRQSRSSLCIGLRHLNRLQTDIGEGHAVSPARPRQRQPDPHHTPVPRSWLQASSPRGTRLSPSGSWLTAAAFRPRGIRWLAVRLRNVLSHGSPNVLRAPGPDRPAPNMRKGDPRQIDLSFARPPARHVEEINVCVVVRVRPRRQVHPGCLEPLSVLTAAVHFIRSRAGGPQCGPKWRAPRSPHGRQAGIIWNPRL